MASLEALNLALPSLPEAFLRLNEVANDPHAEWADAVRAILPDPALTARVLKSANASAARGARPPVATITEAVRLLGMSRLRELALATSVLNAFAALSSLRAVVDHSLEVAAWAIAISEHSSTRLSAEGLLSHAVLHDIGRLVLLTTYADDEALARLSEPASTPAEERALVGFDHCEVGEFLLRSWGLPSSYAAVVRHHHAEGDSRLPSPFVARIAQADRIALAPDPAAALVLEGWAGARDEILAAYTATLQQLRALLA